LVACTAPRDAGPAAYETDLSWQGGVGAWNGTTWSGDYFQDSDLLAWSPYEAVFRAGRLLVAPSPKTEHLATFELVGRPGKVLTKEFYATRPAAPADLAWNRKVFICDTIVNSPTRGFDQDGPRKFPAEARRESWKEFVVLNTSELDEGRVWVKHGEIEFHAPVWCLRVPR
jgi:hypothetical protein